MIASTVKGDSLFPPDKQARLQRFAQIHADALNGPRLPKDPSYAPPPTTPEPWPTGIIETGQAPFPSVMFTVNNVWQDIVNGEHVQVYAGSETADPLQGVVIVRTVSLDLHTVHSWLYRTQSRVGALRIVAASGFQLSFISTNNTTFSFDAASRVLTAQP
jgi:hypothetical protein